MVKRYSLFLGLLLLMASFVAAQIVVPAIPVSIYQDPVAFWKFDEGFGNTTKDHTNNGNTGTLLGGVKWTADSISGYALEFDGVDDKVAIKKTSSVDLVGPVTIEAWIKRKSSSDDMIVSKNGPYYLAVRGDKIEGGIYANDGKCPRSCTTPGKNTWTTVSGTTILKQNIWYKLKVVYDLKTIQVYVNDKLEGSTPKIGEMPQVSQTVNLGWGAPGHNQYFTGILDDVAIYDSAKK